jgi:mRNA interferase RelE/StbE
MTPKPPYSVRIKPSAEKEMDRLPAFVFDHAAATILALETDPRPPGCVKLKGAGKYRLRVGAYRVLYTIDDARRSIEIVAVGHRREVYRGI